MQVEAGLSAPYLKNQLIAYIGNKRRLLSFLEDVFSELGSRCPGGRNAGGGLRFGDCFAGSGSVSRLAKTMGYSVAANDWELYSDIINTAHIRLSEEELCRLFAGYGGIEAVIDSLNSLGPLAADDAYISRYYAPEDTETADYHHERLFYTRENALFIDSVRNRIERMFPGWRLSEDDRLRKCALLAPLLYQAATHANTNGVFKAYHKGFGGHGGDALGRIMAPMRLQPPLTFESLPGRSYEICRQDAADFASGRSLDICYLDPPYNQHQYGSNYFMLNTIARWDRPGVDMSRKPDGSLSVKAGIRSDWKKTRSGFCYAGTAPDELRKLIENIDARHIVLSYNTEGIIPFDELIETLSGYGRTEIFCKDYVIYRGGRQSLARANRNVEYQLVLTPSELPRSSDKQRIRKVLKSRAVVSVLNESFAPRRLSAEFTCEGGRVLLSADGTGLPAETDSLFRFREIPMLSEIEALSEAELEDLYGRLLRCRCGDRKEEAEIIMELISGGGLPLRVYRRHWAMLFRTLRKFAFRKYRDEYFLMSRRAAELLAAEKSAGPDIDWTSIEKKYDELERVAALRIGLSGARSGD